MERGQDFRNQIDANEVGGTEVQGTLFQIIDLPQLLLGVLPGGKEGTGIGHEGLAVYGQQGFFVGTGKELGLELFFQRTDLFGKGRLGNVQSGSSF